MAYDEGLAQRIRERMEGQPGFTEKVMFGGIGFMLRGNMACGVIGDEMLVRLGKEQDEAALAKPHTRQFDFTGKPMSGWVMVAAYGYESDEDLAAWVKLGVDFALSLPGK